MHSENFRSLASCCCTCAWFGPLPLLGSKSSHVLLADRYWDMACGSPFRSPGWAQPTTCSPALSTVVGGEKVGSPWLRIQPA